MNKLKTIALTFIAISYIGMMSGCSSADKHHDHDHDHEMHDHDGEDHDDHDHDHEKHDHGDDEIVIEPSEAEKFGIKVESIVEQPFNDVISVTGQIIGSSSNEAVIAATTPGILTLKGNILIGSEVKAHTTIGTITAQNISGGDPNNAARVAIASAKRQLDRLEPLLREGIVTQREYDAALAEYEAAKAAYSPSASSGTVISPIAGVITQLFVSSGQYVEVGTPIASVARNSTLVIRADLPEKNRQMVGQIKTALFRPSYSNEWISIDSLGGKLTQVAPADAIAKAGFIPVYFTIKNDGSLTNGTYVDVNLLGEGSAPAISLPTDAIVEQQGNYFAYIKSGDHSYEKRRIELGESSGGRRKVVSGLKSGEQVVVKGAIMVKIAESSGTVPEGHTHNH